MSGYGIKRGEGKSFPIVINETNAIARGRYINRLEYRQSDKAEWFTIEVRDRAGNTARKSYFAPKKNAWIKTDEDLAKEQGKFSRVIKNLTDTVLSRSYETGEVASFKEFCNKVISDIGKAYVDKELRVKLVLDKENRPTLPKFAPMFEDPIMVADSETKLVVTQWDKVKPSEIAMDEDKPTVAPDMTLEKTKTGEKPEGDGLDGLPF
jgi:hypothetical protein